MDDLKDILRHRQADFDGEEAKIRLFREYLDEQFGPGNCGLRLQQNQLILMAGSSALASHLRHRLPDITRQARLVYDLPTLKLRIMIGS